jgi:hypothetical protein
MDKCSDGISCHGNADAPFPGGICGGCQAARDALAQYELEKEGKDD